VYKPTPIDTGQVQLPAELAPLLERLAEHVHDIWSCGRIAEGWTHGEHRNDRDKTHPGLIPYAELSEGERDYDRRTMEQTLKAILALGFKIEAPSAAAPGSPPPEGLAQLRAVLEDPAADLNSLLTVWRERTARPGPWNAAPDLYALLARKLLKLGVPMTAGEVLAEGRDAFRDDVRLRQLHGLTLARTGAVESANRLLAGLYIEGNRDEESMGLLARTHKDLGLAAGDPAERERHLSTARELYAEAYAAHPTSYWTGINAASMSTLLGDRETARRLAGQVLEQCTKLTQTPGRDVDDRFWLLATLGEAALNLEEWATAEGWYRKAAQWSFHRFGDINSTRRQARLLLDHLGHDRTLVDRTLPMPRVVVFAGHGIDAPGRLSPRFPPAIEGHVRDAIRAHLRQLDGFVGFAGANNGADILFHETVLELQGESHVVLPYEPDAFCRDMVDTVPGDWKARFERVIAGAARVVVTSRERMNSGVLSFDYADMVLHGLAMTRAQELETEAVGLAVWDGKEGDHAGHTELAVARWGELGLRTETIGTTEFRRRAGFAPSGRIQVPMRSVREIVQEDSKRHGNSRLMCMIFADAVHFSKLTESQVPLFVEHFLGRVAKLLETYPESAVVKNTWGDGLYIVFTNVTDAGLFALELARMASTAPWESLGLPRTLNARIAVHAGPVFKCTDPVLQAVNFTGTHVSRAARIEPITPPGEVYASEAFAALSSLERVDAFRCEYVKQAELAKHYGSFPTYVVRRVRQSAGDAPRVKS